MLRESLLFGPGSLLDNLGRFRGRRRLCRSSVRLCFPVVVVPRVHEPRAAASGHSCDIYLVGLAMIGSIWGAILGRRRRSGHGEAGAARDEEGAGQGSIESGKAGGRSSLGYVEDGRDTARHICMLCESATGCTESVCREEEESFSAPTAGQPWKLARPHRERCSKWSPSFTPDRQWAGESSTPSLHDQPRSSYHQRLSIHIYCIVSASKHRSLAISSYLPEP